MIASNVAGAARRLCTLSAAALVAAATLPGAVAGAAVSSNWAGYVAAPSSTGGAPFSSVSGSWIQPTATCLKGHKSYSAVWVGLGGARSRARGLEQIGTDADCTSSGRAVYSSWFELLPAEAVDVHIAVHPGDQLTASVTVNANRATLRMRDLTTGRRFTTTRHVRAVDVSSAEWIVEAPSICTDSCRTEALTNFSTVTFVGASTTAGGHTGPITDPAWSTAALELRQNPVQSGGRGATAVGGSTKTLIVATPTAATSPTGGFTVRWQEQAVQGERSTPAG